MSALWPQRSTLLVVAVVLAYAGVAILRPGLPGNLAIIDPVILGLVVAGVVSMTRHGSEATSAGAKALPWVWLVLLGSFIGLSTVGVTGWAVSSILRTAFALLTFYCMWHLLVIARVERAAVHGTAIGLGVTVVALLVEQFTYRGDAFFQHPNYAGHYVTMASFLLMAVSRTWLARFAALAALGVGLWQTSSFGAIAMALAMLGVLLFRSLKRNTAVLTLGLIAVAIFGLFISAPGADSLPSISDFDVKGVLSEERFEKSQGSRGEIWGQAISSYLDEPWGLGPDGVAQREIGRYNDRSLEVHADALGYLVERGVLGLIGFIGLWVTIWRTTRNGGLAHVLIVGMLVQGVFRETMHYRHMWLLVALACAYDRIDAQRRAEAAGELEPDEPSAGLAQA